MISILGWILVLIVLWDAFTTIVVPKTVERRVNIAALYYGVVWTIWYKLGKRLPDKPIRSTVLGSFGPISMIFLFLLWAVLLTIGFAIVNYGAGTLPDGLGFGDYLYYSGVTFFTLGYGDVTATGYWGHFLSVMEAGTGFGFLAIVIGYIPVLYGHFSAREHQIMLLDSKAGSSPTAAMLLCRHGSHDSMEMLIEVLKEWETWSARQLEAYLSYPILAYYRSQHDHQSWLASLTAILDACALIEVGFEGDHEWQQKLRFQAQSTFAMGRHVIVDVAYILGAPPDNKAPSRLPPDTFDQLKRGLSQAGIPMKPGREEIFAARVAMYEPYCISLARDLFFTLPAWVPEEGALDNWQFSAWDADKHF